MGWEPWACLSEPALTADVPDGCHGSVSLHTGLKVSLHSHIAVPTVRERGVLSDQTKDRGAPAPVSSFLQQEKLTEGKGVKQGQPSLAAGSFCALGLPEAGLQLCG